MTVIHEAIRQLETILEDTGCDDADAVLKRAPDASRCQYTRGACLEVSFGGKKGYVATTHPVQGTVRVSRMFQSDPSSAEQRTAALGIMNATMGFLCLARHLRACRQECYARCMDDLTVAIGSCPVYTPAHVPSFDGIAGISVTGDPGSAEIMLVTPAALVTEEGLAAVGRWPGEKRAIYLGPSVAGISVLLGREHWCPYGR